MPYFEGLYGFEITKKIELQDLIIYPVHKDFKTARDLARDTENFNLTGIIKYDEVTSKIDLFDLEGILAFIERLDVVIGYKNVFSDLDQAKNDIPNRLYRANRINGGGAVIRSDTFDIEARASFINLALEKLGTEEKNRPDSSVLRKSFFKSIEVFRAKKQFVEVSYYLLYSALESLARFDQDNSECRNSNVPIANFLQDLGFSIRQNYPKDLVRSVASYTHLRNALFHNSKLQKEITCDKEKVTLKMKDYHWHLKLLVPLAILKYMGYEDDEIRWDAWYDRMLY